MVDLPVACLFWVAVYVRLTELLFHVINPNPIITFFEGRKWPKLARSPSWWPCGPWEIYFIVVVVAKPAYNYHLVVQCYKQWS